MYAECQYIQGYFGGVCGNCRRSGNGATCECRNIGKEAAKEAKVDDAEVMEPQEQRSQDVRRSLRNPLKQPEKYTGWKWRGIMVVYQCIIT